MSFNSICTIILGGGVIMLIYTLQSMAQVGSVRCPRTPTWEGWSREQNKVPRELGLFTTTWQGCEEAPEWPSTWAGATHWPVHRGRKPRHLQGPLDFPMLAQTILFYQSSPSSSFIASAVYRHSTLLLLNESRSRPTPGPYGIRNYILTIWTLH